MKRTPEGDDVDRLAMQLRQASLEEPTLWGYVILGALGLLLGLGLLAIEPGAGVVLMLISMAIGGQRFLILGAYRYWLRRRLARFTHEQRAEMLSMLVDTPAAGDIVVPVLRRLEGRRPRHEVVPVNPPPARGDEGTPAE